MIDNIILDFQITFFLAISTILLIIVSFSSRNILKYLPAYLSIPIGYLLYSLNFIDSTFRLLGILSLLLGSFLFLAGTFLDYSETFRIFDKQKLRNKNFLIFLSFTSFIAVLILAINAILLLISCIFLIKIFLKKKSPIYLSLILIMFSAAISFLTRILYYFDIPGSWELSYLILIIFTTNYLLFPVMAYFEKILIQSKHVVKESQEKFSVLFNNSTSGIAYHEIIKDINGKPIDYKIKDINPLYEEILSLKRKKVINKRSIEVYNVEEPPYLEVFAEVAESQKSIDFDTYFSPMDKHFKVSVISQKKGEFITVFDDITEKMKTKQILKDSEEKHRSLIEGLNQVGVGIDIVSLDYKILYQNKVLQEKFGNVKGEVCYKKYMNRKGPCDPCPMKDAIKSNTTEILELMGSDGRYYEIFSAPYPNLDGTVDKAVEIVMDITERMQIENHIKESEVKFRTISEESMVGISIVQDNVFKYINQIFIDYIGYTREEIENWKPGELFDIILIPDQREELKEISRKNQTGENLTTNHLELQLIQKNGEKRVLDMYARSIIYQGRTAGMNISVDITEKKLAEQKLKESEEKYRNLFEGANDPNFILDRDVVIDTNIMTLKIFGFDDKEDIIGLRPWDISPQIQPDGKNSKEKAMAFADKCLEGEPQKFYWKHCKKDGILFDADVSLNRIIIDEKYYIQAIVRDITERLITEQNIKDSEEKYRMLFEGANDAIFLMKDYKFYECNEMTLTIFGFNNKSDIIGLFPWEVSPPTQPDGRNSKTAALEYMDEALNDKALRFYWKHYRKDGVFIDTEVSLNRIKIGNEYYLQAIIRDMTEKIKAELKIRESEEKYRLISENANDLITVLDNQYNHEYINTHAYFNLLGYSKKELIGKSAWYYVHPEDIKRISISREISTVVFDEVEGTDTEELRISHKKGHYLWFEYRSRIFVDEKGEPKVLAILRDISERKNAENLLKESEEKYHNLFEKSPIGIFLFDSNGFLIDGNKTSSETFSGYPVEDSIGKRFTEIIPVFKNSREILKIFLKRMEEQKKGIKLEPVEFKIITQDDKEKWLSWQSSTIKLQDKEIIQAIVLEITAQKEAEQLIVEENIKLQELNDIRQKMIARISHELKTPITSVYGASQALLQMYRNQMNKNIINFVEIIHRGGIRLKTLVENLIDTSKLDSKGYEINQQKENLSDVIREIVNDNKYFANNRNITLVLDLPEELFMNVDKIRIGQAISNILSNAINNTTPEGKVVTSIIDKEDYINIIIKDTGVGITEKEKQHLFEKFGKIERYGKGYDIHTEGPGLGLYISKEIVELHGGEILVESKGRNKGTAFTIRLPKKIENKIIFPESD